MQTNHCSLLKCELAYWVFIDEVEAVGAQILGIVEQNMADAAKKRWYKFRRGIQRPEFIRPFGGINMAFFGDFWQLPPVRQISICSNPFRERANADHNTRKILAMFWSQDAHSSLTHAPFEFAVCKRIDDEWYSDVIDQCRGGCLNDDNYNFLHGYPTRVCGSWSFVKGGTICTEDCQTELDRIRANLPSGLGAGAVYDTVWRDEWLQYCFIECTTCSHERARRKRVLDNSVSNYFFFPFQ